MNPLIYPKFLQDTALKLVFFGGKGGVGKSTCASAAALKLAKDQQGHQFLLVSTDPAHSLFNILSDLVVPENLTVRELDAATSLHKFKARYDTCLKEIAERGTFLDQSDVQGLMNTALPGMDELAAYLEIAEWIQQDKYYRIIIDTAPTGHTLRLLEMPDLIHRWLIALDTLLAKHRYIRRRFAGDSHPDHLDEFLLSMNSRLNVLHGLITDKQRCCFVLVMLAETMSVAESLDLAKALTQKRVALSDLLVNRLIPAHDCPNCTVEHYRQVSAVRVAMMQLPDHLFWSLPLLVNEPRGNLLETLWVGLDLLDKQVVTVLSAARNQLPVHVENPLPLPDSTLRLLIFAGKGGVGKTTLACATALRLHSENPARRILLFSTDPAHSLSDCLQVKVQRHPTEILSHVAAQEIDAEADFKKIRSDYQTELEKFLQEALPHIDITFDREVMEHLLDLAPPGIDEIMALTAVMGHFESGQYDMIILDAAPSGHFLRLLELPELIQDWLRLFFSILLKYRNVMRLPRLSERLVQLSRDLKKNRNLLRNTVQTGVYAVTIPSQLAIEKTCDMLNGLQRLGMPLKALFINQITADNCCELCHAIHLRETEQINYAHAVFPEQSPVKVFRQSEPAGLTDLLALGVQLFQGGEGMYYEH